MNNNNRTKNRQQIQIAWELFSFIVKEAENFMEPTRFNLILITKMYFVNFIIYFSRIPNWISLLIVESQF